MKTIYPFLTAFLILIAPLSSRAQCTGNLTPYITPSLGACGSTFTCVGGQTLTIDLLVSDDNNDVLTLENLTPYPLPASATVSQTLPYTAQAPFTITITWTPAASEYGIDQEVRFQAEDSCTGTSCAFTLKALNPCNFNLTPSVDPSIGSCGGQINGVIGQTTTLDLLIEDADGDSITLDVNSFNPLPASATVSPALPYKGQVPYTVTVTWTPTPSEYQVNQEVRFVVEDSCTGTYCDLQLYAECSSPTIECYPAPITFQANHTGCTAVITYPTPTTTGFPAPVISYNPSPGTPLPLGTNTITATATNDCGSALCTFDIIVTVGDPPLITCPGNITTNATSCLGAPVVFTITGESPFGVPVFTSIPVSGDVFPVGTTTVVGIATDACSNTATCSFSITVVSGLTVDAGADVSSIFGYASTQTINRTAVVSGGTGPYTYSWTLSRPLKCNQVNSSGDELFTGGSCTNNICGSGSTTAAAPSCSGSATINAVLLADAEVCVTVTDANGCTATDCFNITAIDGRCFTGNAGKNKAKICHQTGSASNPYVTICIAKNTANNFIANHPGDYLGPCSSRIGEQDAEEENFLIASPNPFSNITTIRYELPVECYVRLAVYDVIGKEVVTLADGMQQPGFKTVDFNAASLPEGLYFCRLVAGDFTATQKLVLVKK